MEDVAALALLNLAPSEDEAGMDAPAPRVPIAAAARGQLVSHRHTERNRQYREPRWFCTWHLSAVVARRGECPAP